MVYVTSRPMAQIIQGDSKLLSGFPLHVRAEQEAVNKTRKVSFATYNFSVTFSYFISSFFFLISGLKTMSHGNRDQNVDSSCIVLKYRIISD